MSLFTASSTLSVVSSSSSSSSSDASLSQSCARRDANVSILHVRPSLSPADEFFSSLTADTVQQRVKIIMQQRKNDEQKQQELEDRYSSGINASLLDEAVTATTALATSATSLSNTRSSTTPSMRVQLAPTKRSKDDAKIDVDIVSDEDEEEGQHRNLKKRGKLSIETKLEIVQAVQKGAKQIDVAKQFGVRSLSHSSALSCIMDQILISRSGVDIMLCIGR